MLRSRFHLTQGAIRDYQKAIYQSAEKFGVHQAKIYREQLRAGFAYIANNHKDFNSSHREALAEGTDFSIYLVRHHYVVYQAHSDLNIIIAAVFPERMDIPTRLKELQFLSRHEIAAIRHQLEKL